jgi:hypothetical protein
MTMSAVPNDSSILCVLSGKAELVLVLKSFHFHRIRFAGNFFFILIMRKDYVSIIDDQRPKEVMDC